MGVDPGVGIGPVTRHSPPTGRIVAGTSVMIQFGQLRPCPFLSHLTDGVKADLPGEILAPCLCSRRTAGLPVVSIPDFGVTAGCARIEFAGAGDRLIFGVDVCRRRPFARNSSGMTDAPGVIYSDLERTDPARAFPPSGYSDLLKRGEPSLYRRLPQEDTVRRRDVLKMATGAADPRRAANRQGARPANAQIRTRNAANGLDPVWSGGRNTHIHAYMVFDTL